MNRIFVLTTCLLSATMLYTASSAAECPKGKVYEAKRQAPRGLTFYERLSACGCGGGGGGNSDEIPPDQKH